MSREESSKKTANGLGSIDQLPSGLWRWRVSVRTTTGKRVRLSGTAKSDTLAKKALVKAVTDNERGLLAAPDRTTVKEYATKWLEQQKDIRVATRRDYALNLSYAFETIGEMKVKDVRPTHIKDMLNLLKARVMQTGKNKTMSHRTLGMVRARLRSVFDEAVSDQLIFANPVAAVKRLKADDEEDESIGQALEPDQAARFYEIGQALFDAGVARLWPALFSAISVGFRRGEVMGLEWLHVNFKSDVIEVRQTLSEIAGEPTLGKPKTKNSIRDIPMTSSLRAMLEAHQRAQAKECERVGRAWSATGPVFATIEGGYTAPSNLRRALKGVLEWSTMEPIERKRDSGLRDKNGKKIWEKYHVSFDERLKAIPRDHRAKLEAIARDGKPLPDLRVHDLRHTAGTLMLRRKMPVETVSKILGHASISITLDVYRHVSDREIKLEMVDLFDAPLPVRHVVALVMN
jgi:integrase